VHLCRTLATIAFVSAAATAHAATFTVVSTEDDGSGSLANAIAQANASPGPDTIAFDIPGSDVRRIRTTLPPITETVTIDGYTQPGSSPNTLAAGATNAVLLIELDATDMEPSGALIDVRASGTVLRGLAIWNVPYGLTHSDRSAAIDIASGLIDVVVEGCFIGTDATGQTATRGGDGIKSDGRIRIGGSAPAQRNLISQNWTGIELQRKHSVVQGNLLGTDADGDPRLGNGAAVLLSGDGANDNLIGGTEAGQGNLIAGNDKAIHVASTGSGNTFLGNSIHSNNRGIVLRDSMHSVNDELDRDSGPNGVQNFFEVTHARINGETLRVEGYLHSSPGSYIIELFISSGTEFAGEGDAETRISRFNLEIQEGQNAAFYAADFDLELPPSTFYVSATATSENTGDTSEISLAELAQDGGELLTVTNTLDSGTGSLRAAVVGANADEDVNTIAFAIPGAGPHVFEPVEGFVLSQPVIVDGFSQPGAHPNAAFRGSDAKPLIVLDGAASEDGKALTVLAPALVRGLVIGGFGGSAITANSPAASWIEGNFLGTDPTGTLSRANGFGVHVLSTAFQATIGGKFRHQQNLVSGNDESGILNEGFSSSIWGNLIGASAGDLDLGNGMHGVEARFGYADIGPFGRFGSANRIRGNAGAGVRVTGFFWNTIQANEIFGNGALGIDLGTAKDEGVTENDVNDLDDGPNYLKNAPVLTSALLAKGKLVVSGYIDVGISSGGDYLEFFASRACDPSGYGEGERYLNARTLPASSGVLPFELPLPTDLTAGFIVTATARESGDTSEFSNCVVAAPACGDVSSDGKVAAADALRVLKAALGSEICLPCVCDTNGDGDMTATDALRTLRSAVNPGVVLSCVACS
jgi:parallel beta-helix repeat protein